MKNVAGLVGAVALTISLAACDGGSASSSKSTAAAVASSSASTSTSAASTSHPAPSTETASSPASRPAAPSPVTRTVTHTAAPQAAAPHTAAPQTAAPTSGCKTPTGQDFDLGGVSCDFAKNVYQAWQSGAAGPDNMFSAYSPATGKTYRFTCMSNTIGVTSCDGGTMSSGSIVAWHE